MTVPIQFAAGVTREVLTTWMEGTRVAELDWILMSSGNVDEPVCPKPAHTYDLFNTTEEEALIYGVRDHGINLTWGDPGRSDNVRFERASGTDEPLKFGELIAINVRVPGNKHGGFLRRQLRDAGGISLKWGDLPYFEWQIKGGTDGTEVHTNKVIALFNTVEGDYLFYDPRSYGINLKWVRDKGKYNKHWFIRLYNVVSEKYDEFKDKLP